MAQLKLPYDLPLPNATGSDRELPLRVLIDEDSTPIIRCLCGAELAAVRNRELTYDFSPGGLIRMVLHAKHCNRAPE